MVDGSPSNQRPANVPAVIQYVRAEDGVILWSAYVQAGGGWVTDSDPEAEYQESVNKAKAMMKAVALADTFA